MTSCPQDGATSSPLDVAASNRYDTTKDTQNKRSKNNNQTTIATTRGHQDATKPHWEWPEVEPTQVFVDVQTQGGPSYLYSKTNNRVFKLLSLFYDSICSSSFGMTFAHVALPKVLFIPTVNFLTGYHHTIFVTDIQRIL